MGTERIRSIKPKLAGDVKKAGKGKLPWLKGACLGGSVQPHVDAM